MEITILYLQEFDRSGANLVCNMAGYEAKIYKIFQKLKALDGNRKNVPMNYNLKEALPPEEEIDDDAYDAGQTEWFDRAELEERAPEKHRFEPSQALRREEKQFEGNIADMKALLAKKTNILQY